MQRRHLISAAAMAPLPAFAEDAATLLARGGMVLLLRHALTGVGLAMGEALVVNAAGAAVNVAARLRVP